MRELLPAWPPTASASRPRVVSPSDAPYTAAASPAGPPPTTTRSKQRPGRLATVMPRYSASTPTVGRRKTEPVAMTTGSSEGPTANSRSSASTSASLSGSSQACGMRLRKTNSRSRPVSGENLDPMTRMDVLAPDNNSVRRAMNPARITSLNAGCVAMT